MRSGQETRPAARKPRTGAGKSGAVKSGRKNGKAHNNGVKGILLLTVIGVLLVLLLLVFPGTSSGSTVTGPAADTRSTQNPSTETQNTADPATSPDAGEIVPDSRDPDTRSGTQSSGADGHEGVPPASGNPVAGSPASGSGAQPEAEAGTSSSGGDRAPAVVVSTGRRQPSPEQTSPVRTAPVRTVPKATEPGKTPISTVAVRDLRIPPVKAGKIALVIDDVGYNRDQLLPFLKFPGPITFAVLPELQYTASCAEAIRKAGKQAILHFPMEAVGGADPGPGAVFRSMDESEVLSVIRKNLEQIPGVRGVNNHQGSAVTQDDRIMRLLFGELSRRKLFFLDSMTTPASVGKRLARETGLKFLERDVFLDNDKAEAAIRAAVDGGLRIVQNQGNAVFIGHVWSADLARILIELYPSLLEHGFEFSYLEELLPGVRTPSSE